MANMLGEGLLQLDKIYDRYRQGQEDAFNIFQKQAQADKISMDMLNAAHLDRARRQVSEIELLQKSGMVRGEQTPEGLNLLAPAPDVPLDVLIEKLNPQQMEDFMKLNEEDQMKFLEQLKGFGAVQPPMDRMPGSQDFIARDLPEVDQQIGPVERAGQKIGLDQIGLVRAIPPAIDAVGAALFDKGPPPPASGYLELMAKGPTLEEIAARNPQVLTDAELALAKSRLAGDFRQQELKAKIGADAFKKLQDSLNAEADRRSKEGQSQLSRMKDLIQQKMKDKTALERERIKAAAKGAGAKSGTGGKELEKERKRVDAQSKDFQKKVSERPYILRDRTFQNQIRQFADSIKDPGLKEQFKKEFQTAFDVKFRTSVGSAMFEKLKSQKPPKEAALKALEAQKQKLDPIDYRELESLIKSGNY